MRTKLALEKLTNTETLADTTTTTCTGSSDMSGCVPDEDYISEVITAVRRRVTIAGQSRKESCNVRETFSHPKHKTRMNVRTIHSDGRTAQVCKEIGTVESG